MTGTRRAWHGEMLYGLQGFRDLIVRGLEVTNGNVTRTAKLLKISRKSLQMKMKEFGLRGEEPV